MMTRDRSRSKFSSANSKNKLKQTIRQAMSKTPMKKITNQLNQNKKLRSSSLRALKIYNRDIHQQDSSQAKSTVKRNYSQKILPSPKSKQKQLSFQKEKQIIGTLTKQQLPLIVSYQWWHCNGFQISTQKKIKQVNLIKQTTLYFTYTDKSLKNKKLIVSIENEDMIIQDPLLQIYLINTKKKCIENINQSAQKINLKNKNITDVFITREKSDQMNYDINSIGRLKSLSSEQSSFKYNPKMQRLLYLKIQKYKDNFFDGIMKQQIQNQNSFVQFYFCIHLFKKSTQIDIQSMLKLKMANQSIYKQLNFQNSKQKNKKGTQKGSKTLFNNENNIKSLSQVALFKFKR